jgi:uncharacterized protein
MAIHQDQVDRIVRGFISRLEEEIPIQEVILFGSYSTGKAKAHSDIDLAVISNWFEGKPKIENVKFLMRIAARYNTLIEALPFTEREYHNMDRRTLLAGIAQKGRKYKSAN